METLSQIRVFCRRPGGAVLASAVLAALVMSLTLGFGGYGLVMFVFGPFLIGYMAAFFYDGPRARSWFYLVGLSLGALFLSSLLLLLLGLEGLVCILMALPLGGPMAAFGATVVYWERRYGLGSAGATAGMLAVFPLLLVIEPHVSPEPPVYSVTTSIDVDATPGQVWEQVIAFPEIPPPTEFLFRFGIAYPIRAEIEGKGVGAIRRCVFSTGAFVEPIEIWDEPRMLKFSVESNPAPMREWTPYPSIEPPHLNGFMESRQGQFKLEPLDEGGTRLIGTTWYSHGLWPAFYWRLWSDWIIHKIHLRVLEHIRREAEASI